MNHLTTAEIEEAVRQDRLTAQQQTHIVACAQCRQVHLQTQQVFQALQSANEKHEPSTDLWQRIESSYQHKQKTNKKGLNWKPWSLVSIAASLLIVIGLQWKQLDQSQHQQYQLQAMMLESQMLERTLKQSQFQQTTQSLQIVQLKMQLTEIDTLLQQAYATQRDFADIKRLWQRRIELLKQIQQLSSQPADVMAI